jgi:hypothetical protein
VNEETLYPVCPDRNVVSAFQCFLGPDSRGLERFFAEQRMQWADDALLNVREQGRRSAKVFSRAIADLNPVLTHSWIATSYAFGVLILGLFHAIVAMRAWTPRLVFAAAALKEFYGAWLPHGGRNGKKAASVLGRWAAHYRMPVLLSPRTVGGLPV